MDDVDVEVDVEVDFALWIVYGLEAINVECCGCDCDCFGVLLWMLIWDILDTAIATGEDASKELGLVRSIATAAAVEDICRGAVAVDVRDAELVSILAIWLPAA